MHIRAVCTVLLSVSFLAVAGCSRQGGLASHVGSYPATPAPGLQPDAREQGLARAGDAREIWQLRSVLNVAALGCRRAGDRDIGRHYNRMLKQHQALLAASYAAEQDRYRRANGARWQAVQDHEMTALYNRYANLLQAPLFCATATSISAEAVAVQPDRFAAFAAAALPRLAASRR